MVLARWNASTRELKNATLLPKDFVAEGVTPIPEGKVLVDDLDEMILVATEKSGYPVPGELDSIPTRVRTRQT